MEKIHIKEELFIRHLFETEGTIANFKQLHGKELSLII